MTEPLDPSIYAFRADMAAADCKGKVSAPKFVEGELYTCSTDHTPTREKPDLSVAQQDSELLFGEVFRVYDIKDGVAWGQNVYDRQVGYVPTAALEKGTQDPTHMIDVAAAFWMAGAGTRFEILGRLSLGTMVTVTGPAEGNYVPIWPTGFVRINQLADAGVRYTDPVAMAEKLLGTPYQWGGRGSYGIDCSGMTQLVFKLCGVHLQRFSALQAKQGKEVPFDQRQRGDLLVCPGHVALVVDKDTIIHANASRHGSLEYEPMADAAKRYDFKVRRLI